MQTGWLHKLCFNSIRLSRVCKWLLCNKPHYFLKNDWFWICTFYAAKQIMRLCDMQFYEISLYCFLVKHNIIMLWSMYCKLIIINNCIKSISGGVWQWKWICVLQLHLETFGKSGCRRIVPGQYLAIDPKGRAVMIGNADIS